MKRYINSINRTLDSKYMALFMILLCGGSIMVLAYLNEVCEGGGDNYWHYYFSRYAPVYPKFFLHHWGKPFFILLSTPFSQFGFFALNVFNILCGICSAWIAYLWCKKLNLGYSFVVIPIVLFAPVYTEVIQSALTEPLFSLLIILSAYLLYNEKYFLGAIVASFLMYSRSEGTFIIIIFASYLLLIRKWKFIPFLATAFMLYSFAGYFSGHDFLWFFTENPYKEVSPYGHGDWNHFTKSYHKIFGVPFTFCFLAGLLLLLRGIYLNKEFLFWKEPKDNSKLFYLLFIPSLAFFLFHTYAWAEGKYASAGLWRVMASIVPIMAVIAMLAIDFLYRFKYSFYRVPLLIYFLIVMVASAFKYLHYPLKAKNDWKVEKEAADWFKKIRQPESVVYYSHVGIMFYGEFDPFSELNKECYGFSISNCGQDSKKRKLYYFWDSALSETLCGNKLSDLEKCENLMKIKEFSEKEFKLIVFESK